MSEVINFNDLKERRWQAYIHAAARRECVLRGVPIPVQWRFRKVGYYRNIDGEVLGETFDIFCIYEAADEDKFIPEFFMDVRFDGRDPRRTREEDGWGPGGLIVVEVEVEVDDDA